MASVFGLVVTDKLGHSHLHWQHNVINCTCDKSSISPSLPPTHNWSQPLFFEDYINFVTWSPYYYILHNLPWKPFLCRKCQELISIKPKQEHFASLQKIIDQNDHLFPSFLFPPIIEIKNIPAPLPPIFYPPPLPLTPPTLLKRQIGA